MREILFKAKRTDTGEWVEGSLITGAFLRGGKDIPYILCPDKADYDCFEDFDEENGIFEVDPETVCWCTGLRGKNGKRIWDNDICRFKRGKNYYIGKVVWNEKTAAFEMWFDVTVGAYGEKATYKILLVHLDEIEVIGNIFDNPELLGKSKV